MKFNANNNRTVRITKYERFNLIPAQNNLISIQFDEKSGNSCPNDTTAFGFFPSRDDR